MAIINQFDKRSGITYVYESVSWSTSRKNVTKTPDYGQFQEFFTFTA